MSKTDFIRARVEPELKQENIILFIKMDFMTK